MPTTTATGKRGLFEMEMAACPAASRASATVSVRRRPGLVSSPRAPGPNRAARSGSRAALGGASTRDSHEPNRIYSQDIGLVDPTVLLPPQGGMAGEIARNVNVLLNDTVLWRSGDRVSHASPLFRRTLVWSVLFLLFSLVVLLSLFAFFYEENTAVLQEMKNPTATFINDFVGPVEHALRCPCRCVGSRVCEGKREVEVEVEERENAYVGGGGGG